MMIPMNGMDAWRTFCVPSLGQSEVLYQFARLQSIEQWWQWALIALVIFSLFAYFTLWYRRDTQELPKALGWGLLLLRLTALVGIIIFFFQLQKRTDIREVNPSRVAMLVDTSLSMTLPSKLPETSTDTPLSRIDSLLEELQNGQLLSSLRKQHQVVIYRFDSASRPIQVAQLPRDDEKTKTDSGMVVDPSALGTVRLLAWIASILGVIALLSFFFGYGGKLRRWNQDTVGYWYLASIVTAISGIVFFSVALVRIPELPVAELWKTGTWQAQPLANPAQDQKQPEDRPEDLKQRLVADGVETRLGDAIKSLLDQERGSALSAVILVTDGRNNAGLEPLAAAVTAQGLEIKLHAIGMGSDRMPPNLRLVEVEAPKRVYPGDAFTLSAVVQANGMANEKGVARLRKRSAASTSAPWSSEDEKPITLPADDQFVSVAFEIEPKEIGKWIYEVSILPPKADFNEKDNSQAREVQVIERRNRVLLVSSGPTREFQFVRNLLFRDRDIESHLYLQSGKPGMSQEATEILDSFPSTWEEMLNYDAVLSFDTDWLQLTENQIQLLEKWVSNQAGGLLLIAGPVATPKWSSFSGTDPKVTLLRGLSPVVLDSRGTRLTSGRFESDKSWNLEFADGALQNDFLWLDNDLATSEAAWQRFSGVFSYFACYEPKPGAKIIATFSDPTTSRGGQQPIYLASQFYGAGRVVFQGSGEMWRVRELSDAYFESYYTKLVRWISQGRLLRDSDRGILLLDKEQAFVGEQVSVRAVLKNEKFEPLTDPEMKARLTDPSGKSQTVTLRLLQDVGQPGVYVGQFICTAEGLFDIQLALGSLAKQEILSQQVLARVPAREVQQPQRNDPLLTELTGKTGGVYFKELSEAVSQADNTTRLAAAIKPQDQINKIVGSPDQDFQRRLMTALMALIGGALSLEWLLRRLNKLA